MRGIALGYITRLDATTGRIEDLRWSGPLPPERLTNVNNVLVILPDLDLTTGVGLQLYDDLTEVLNVGDLVRVNVEVTKWQAVAREIYVREACFDHLGFIFDGTLISKFKAAVYFEGKQYRVNLPTTAYVANVDTDMHNGIVINQGFPNNVNYKLRLKVVKVYGQRNYSHRAISYRAYGHTIEYSNGFWVSDNSEPNNVCLQTSKCPPRVFDDAISAIKVLIGNSSPSILVELNHACPNLVMLRYSSMYS